MLKPEPISVSQLNNYIKEKVGNDEFLNNVYIKGEISNFKHHYTGHMYFTLKDENSLIKCVMFKTSTATLNFIPKDGMKVIVFGTVSVFERDGIYQIYCKAMQEDGIGDLYAKYERLKAKLEEEGLFDKEYKKDGGESLIKKFRLKGIALQDKPYNLPIGSNSMNDFATAVRVYFKYISEKEGK